MTTEEICLHNIEIGRTRLNPGDRNMADWTIQTTVHEIRLAIDNLIEGENTLLQTYFKPNEGGHPGFTHNQWYIKRDKEVFTHIAWNILTDIQDMPALDITPTPEQDRLGNLLLIYLHELLRRGYFPDESDTLISLK